MLLLLLGEKAQIKAQMMKMEMNKHLCPLENLMRNLRFTWTMFLTSNDETFDMFTSFVRKTQKQLGNQFASIRSDHGTELKNAKFAEFCDEHDIDHKFSTARIPQQNGAVERKNRTLEYMARTMLLSSKLPHSFWEYDDEGIGLVRDLNETIAHTEVVPEEGTCDGTGSSTQGNLIGGTEQRGTDSQTSREPVPYQQNIEGTSRGNQLVVKSYRNKLDEDGTVTRNKARLVVQRYSQEEGINYDETFAPVTRLEAIRLLIAFDAYMEFTLHQMDVKSAFLNAYLKEEVFVKQPPGFEIKEYPDHVYKLDKALYGLKHALRAWYERLSNILLEHDY
ncbi:uncharacterized protein [Nicotiana sylvestris]|uniref:uncharacterized protein n=1 Tax=Nicotiana sylvestris TaxID=4096 RepID=UPI00388C3459